MLRLAALALAVTIVTTTGCSQLTPNHTRGFAAVGGGAVIAGSLTMIAGASCDQETWNAARCSHDAPQLATGAIVTAAGAALFAYGVWRLAHDGPETSPPSTTTPSTPARITPPSPSIRAASRSLTAPRD